MLNRSWGGAVDCSVMCQPHSWWWLEGAFILDCCVTGIAFYGGWLWFFLPSMYVIESCTCTCICKQSKAVKVRQCLKAMKKVLSHLSEIWTHDHWVISPVYMYCRGPISFSFILCAMAVQWSLPFCLHTVFIFFGFRILLHVPVCIQLNSRVTAQSVVLLLPAL